MPNPMKKKKKTTAKLKRIEAIHTCFFFISDSYLCCCRGAIFWDLVAVAESLQPAMMCTINLASRCSLCFSLRSLSSLFPPWLSISTLFHRFTIASHHGVTLTVMHISFLIFDFFHLTTPFSYLWRERNRGN